MLVAQAATVIPAVNALQSSIRTLHPGHNLVRSRWSGNRTQHEALLRELRSANGQLRSI